MGPYLGTRVPIGILSYIYIYWVPIGSLLVFQSPYFQCLFHKKMGPYLKAWGSQLVWESVSLGFAENICNLASAAPVPWWSESRLERECNIFQSAQVTVRNFVEYITQARLLLDRVQVLCRGVAEVGRRRRWQEGEERRMGKEQRAHHLSLLLGRAVYRRGDLELAWVKKWFDDSPHYCPYREYITSLRVLSLSFASSLSVNQFRKKCIYSGKWEKMTYDICHWHMSLII